MNVRDEKIALRKEIKAKLLAMDEALLTAGDSEIQKRLEAMPEYAGSGEIFFYYGTGREISTAGLIKNALAHGRTVALPVSLPGGKMLFRAVKTLEGLVPGAYGIPQPPDSWPETEPAAGAVAVVPGLCFDEKRGRLGHGAGYYDRYLEKYRLYTIGLCRETLMCQSLPMGSYDRRMDAVVTEARVIK